MGVGMSWEYGSRTRCPRGRHRVQPSAMHLDCEHDFQTRPHPPARTNDLLLSVVIRSLQGIDLPLCFRIRTDSDA